MLTVASDLGDVLRFLTVLAAVLAESTTWTNLAAARALGRFGALTLMPVSGVLEGGSLAGNESSTASSIFWSSSFAFWSLSFAFVSSRVPRGSLLFMTGLRIGR